MHIFFPESYLCILPRPPFNSITLLLAARATDSPSMSPPVYTRHCFPHRRDFPIPRILKRYIPLFSTLVTRCKDDISFFSFYSGSASAETERE